jgi:hypothetical protein
VELGNDVNVSITADVTYSDGSYAGAGFVSIKSDGTLGGYAVATNNKIKYKKGEDFRGATFDSGSGISGASHGIMTATCKNGTLTITVVDDEKAVSKKNWSASYHVTEGERNYLALGGQYANRATFSNIKVINGDKKYRVNSFQDPSEEDEPSGEVVTYVLNANDISTGNITSNTYAGTSNFFTLKADDTTNSKGALQHHFTVDSNKKSGPVSGTNYTQRIKSNGAGTKDYRSIHFTTSGASTVIIEGMSSSSDSRTSTLYKNDGTVVGSLTNDGSAIGSTTINVSAPGSYYITQDNGFNYYGVIVRVSS